MIFHHTKILIAEYEGVVKQTGSPCENTWRFWPTAPCCRSLDSILAMAWLSGDARSVTLACIAGQNAWLCSELLITLPEASTGRSENTNKDRRSRQQGVPPLPDPTHSHTSLAAPVLSLDPVVEKYKCINAMCCESAWI